MLAQGYPLLLRLQKFSRIYTQDAGLIRVVRWPLKLDDDAIFAPAVGVYSNRTGLDQSTRLRLCTPSETAAHTSESLGSSIH